MQDKIKYVPFVDKALIDAVKEMIQIRNKMLEEPDGTSVRLLSEQSAKALTPEEIDERGARAMFMRAERTTENDYAIFCKQLKDANLRNRYIDLARAYREEFEK